MPLYRLSSGLLQRGGKIAVSSTCCCGVPCSNCTQLFVRLTGLEVSISGFVNFDATLINGCDCDKGIFGGGVRPYANRVRHNLCSALNGVYVLEDMYSPGCYRNIFASGSCSDPGILIYNATCAWTNPPCITTKTELFEGRLLGIGQCLTCSGGTVTASTPGFTIGGITYVDGVCQGPSSSAVDTGCCAAFAGGTLGSLSVVDFCNGLPIVFTRQQLDCSGTPFGLVTITIRGRF